MTPLPPSLDASTRIGGFLFAHLLLQPQHRAHYFPQREKLTAIDIKDHLAMLFFSMSFFDSDCRVCFSRGKQSPSFWIAQQGVSRNLSFVSFPPPFQRA